MFQLVSVLLIALDFLDVFNEFDLLLDLFLFLLYLEPVDIHLNHLSFEKRVFYFVKFGVNPLPLLHVEVFFEVLVIIFLLEFLFVFVFVV